MLINRTKAALLYLGLLLIAAAIILGAGFFSGLIQLPENIISGEATVHTIARLAVIGCLCAAVGSLERTN